MSSGAMAASAPIARFRRQAWVIGLIVLFIALFVFTRIIQPDYGADGFGSLVRAALPFVYAVAAQTVVVIAGGIDLSIASMMALTSVTAATLMDGASEPFGIVAVVAVLALGLVLGAVNGLLIVISRVPDIVVTLAMLFVWQGTALLVRDSPGGASAEWLKELVVGNLSIPGIPATITDWVPKALILIVVTLAAVWLPLMRSRLGLSIYAIGSSSLAAFRSGVDVARTKVIAYAIAGLFSSMCGLALTMSTGQGAPIPGPYLLASVAAVVLGGVALSGGKGGLVGPIVAVFALRLVRSDLTFLAVDPNVTTIVEGTIMVIVVMLGALLAMRSRQS